MPSVESAQTGRSEKYIDDEQLIIQALNSDGTPRRPMNAFMIFARRRRPQVSAANQTMRTGEISKILSREWATMPMSEKEFYLEQAKRLKDVFNSKYPDYVYRRRPNNSRRKPKGIPTLSAVDPNDDSSDTATNNTHYEWPSPSDAPDELPPGSSAPPARSSAYPPAGSDYYTPRLHDTRGVDLLPSHSPSSPNGYSPYVYPAPADPPSEPWSSNQNRSGSQHSAWPPPTPSSQYTLRGQRSLTALQTSRHQSSPQPHSVPGLSSGLPSAGPLSSGLPPPQRPWSAATSAGSPSSASSASAYPNASTNTLHGGTGTLHPAHPTPSPAPYFDAHSSPTPTSAYPSSHHESFFSGSSAGYGSSSYSHSGGAMHAGQGSHLQNIQSGYYRDSPRSLAPPHPYASTGSAGGMLPSKSSLWERNK